MENTEVHCRECGHWYYGSALGGSAGCEFIIVDNRHTGEWHHVGRDYKVLNKDGKCPHFKLNGWNRFKIWIKEKWNYGQRIVSAIKALA